MAQKKLYRCPRFECDAIVSGARNLRYHVNAHRKVGEVVPALPPERKVRELEVRFDQGVLFR